ncbi:MAG: chorismate synthase [Peptoniphilaceae bacterium]
MSYSFGDIFKISLFGQSHSEEMGILIDGLPAGKKIDLDFINCELDRRRPGKNNYSTSRKESDKFRIVSGLVDGYTCGAPLCGLIKNKDFKSKDYSQLKDKPRPSHADFPAYIKYKTFNDINGGGQFSGRMTAPMTIGGAIAKKILEEKNIFIGAHIKSIKNIEDSKIDYANVKYEDLKSIASKEFPVIDEKIGRNMIELIEDIKSKKDSLGGIVEVVVFGLPIGLGEPIYNSVEAKISSAIFSIPGVRGIEFGTGFKASEMTGSQHNDEYYYRGSKVRTKTNNSGGVIGGMTNGMPLIFKVAIKPTSSIGKIQKTVNLKDKRDTDLEISGRHDPCIVPRALPALESITAIALLDLMMVGGFYELR